MPAGGGSSILLLPTGAHLVAGPDVLRAAVDRDRDDQHRGEHAKQRAVGEQDSERAPSASGSKAPTMMPDNVCMQATPSITTVLSVACRARSAGPDDAAAVRHHHGAGGAEEADADDGADRHPVWRADASVRVARDETIIAYANLNEVTNRTRWTRLL